MSDWIIFFFLSGMSVCKCVQNMRNKKLNKNDICITLCTSQMSAIGEFIGYSVYGYTAMAKSGTGPKIWCKMDNK